MQVLIDSQVVDTFSQVGADALLNRTYAMAKGLHTISFKGLGTGTAFVKGLVCRDKTSAAPLVLQAGNCGRNITNLNSASFVWDAKPGAAAMAADLAIIKVTVNDSNAGLSRANYLLQLEAMMTSLAVTADICLMVSFPSDNANTYNGALDAIVNAIHDLASDFGASVVDCREVYGVKYSRAQARGLAFNADHGNATGYQREVDLLLSTLKPVGL